MTMRETDDECYDMNLSSIPNVGQWFQALPVVYIVFIAICCALVVVIFVLTLKMVWVVHYCVPNEYYQGDLYFIIWIPLFVSLTCLIGNIIPRTAAILYAVGLVYLMMCLHTTIVLIIRLFGTRKEMTDWLIAKDKRLQFDVRPYCCCCHCLPVMKPTTKRVRYLTYLVKQSPIVRIFLQLVIVILNLEGVAEVGPAVKILNVICVASTLLAIFICHVIVTATRDHLTPYNMYAIYRCVDLSQVLFTLQKFVLDIIAWSGGMGALSMATPLMVSRFWHNVAMTFELTAICVAMFLNIRPEKSEFFGEKTVTRNNGNNVPLTDL